MRKLPSGGTQTPDVHLQDVVRATELSRTVSAPAFVHERLEGDDAHEHLWSSPMEHTDRVKAHGSGPGHPDCVGEICLIKVAFLTSST